MTTRRDASRFPVADFRRRTGWDPDPWNEVSEWLRARAANSAAA
jgi:hypothetical protein